MDVKNKRLLLSSFIILGVLILMSFFVYGELSSATIESYGTLEGNSTLSKGSDDKVYNITITHDGTSGDNITTFNVTIPDNYTAFIFISTGDIAEAVNGSNLDLYSTDAAVLSNVTVNSDGTVADWKCLNQTTTLITCANNTAEAALGISNSSIILRINATAEPGNETTPEWIITTSADGQPDVNSTTLNLSIDGLSPRILFVNVTDGNGTRSNGTNFFGGDINATLPSVLDDQAWTVYVEVTDPNLETLLMYVQNNDSGNASVDVNTAVVTMTNETSTTTTALFTGVIADAQTLDSNFTTFVFVVNDTLNQIRYHNNTDDGGADYPFKIEVNSTIPRIGFVNITDANTTTGGNTVSIVSSDTSTKYLKSGQDWIFNVETTGDNRTSTTDGLDNQTGVVLYYTNNGSAVSTTVYENKIDVENLSSISGSGLGIYSVAIPAGEINDTNVSNFLLVMTSARDNYTTLFSGSITADGTVPTSTISTTDTDNQISVGNTIKYTCTSSDTASDVAGSKYTFELVKPGSVTITYADQGSSYTFSSTDTGTAGIYTVKCKAEDNVGNVGSFASKELTVLYSAGAAAGGGGEGGGGAAAVEVTFDVDFTTLETATASLSIAEGSSRTFSFDGATTHTIRVTSLSDTSAVIRIESDPVEVTLGISEAKEVDINDDGINDLKVTLNAIANGVADIAIEKLERGAAIIAEEETRAREEAEVTPEVPEEAQPSVPIEERGAPRTGLIVTIIVIIVVVALLYFFMKKKKK